MESDIKDRHTRLGLSITYGVAVIVILFLSSPFKGLIWSQVMLGAQLPVTVFLLVGLTSSRKVMGEHANKPWPRLALFAIAGTITFLNILLFSDVIR